MSSELIFELGCEELPASFISPALAVLEETWKAEAARLRIAHGERNPNVAPLLVLLVGCWFDGVLFRLSLAVLFWILLLAGTWDLPAALAPLAVLGRIARRLAGAAQTWLRDATPTMPPEKPSLLQRLRRWGGLAALTLLLVYVYWPDIPGGILSASFRNPWKVAGLKATVLPCS